jgi:hypothetical protein
MMRQTSGHELVAIPDATSFGGGGQRRKDTRIATFAAFLTYGVVLGWVMLTLFHPAIW